MSKTSSSRDQKIDYILLGSAAILIIGLFLFNPSEKNDDAHDEAASHLDASSQSASETDAQTEAKVEPAPAKSAATGSSAQETQASATNTPPSNVAEVKSKTSPAASQAPVTADTASGAVATGKDSAAAQASATSGAATTPQKELAALQARLTEMEKQNVELQGKVEATQGFSQQMLAAQAEAYQARYEDLLKRMNDLTKGLSESLRDHEKEFAKENAK